MEKERSLKNGSTKDDHPKEMKRTSIEPVHFLFKKLYKLIDSYLNFA